MAKISAKYKVIYIIDPARARKALPLLWKSSRRWWKRRGLVSLDELGSASGLPINDLPGAIMSG